MTYHAFCMMRYHPGGGWNDWIGSFDEAAQAREAALSRLRASGEDGEAQVVDGLTGKIVWSADAVSSYATGKYTRRLEEHND